jgi:hypothetical protein
MKPTRLRLVKSTEKRPVAATGRQPNAAYRSREHLTEHEMDQLLAALKRKRHGQRDWLIGLLIYRHGLRVMRRLKGSHESRHYLDRDELAGLKVLRRHYAANGIRGPRDKVGYSGWAL